MNALTKAPRAKPNTPPPPTPLDARQITEYLDYAMTALTARRAEIIEALNQCAKAYPTIDDDDTLGEVAENVRIANVLGRSADEKRKTEKAPFLEGGRTVDGWFARFSVPLTAAATPVQKAMDEYGARKAKQARDAAEAAHKLAQAEEQRRLDEAAAAMRARGPDIDAALEAAAEASRAAEQAGTLARGRSSALTRTRGVYGASASVRTTWRWEVSDINAVPREYLTVDENAIKEAVRLNRDESGKPTIQIPGIRFVAETKMAVR